MKTTFKHHRHAHVRTRALALILALLAPPLPTFAFGSDELPSTPAAKLQLQGTLASMIVAPSKLDNGPAQTSAPPAPALQIVILEGEDVSNNIKERTAREPIVQVQDENHKPVAGAAVLFTITSQGGSHAGATFAQGAKTYTGTTDANGNVTAHGFHPNGHTGQFHVNVTASKGQLTTHTTIAQTNVAAATTAATTSTITGFITTHVVLVSVVAAGVVAGSVTAGVVAANQNNATTITTGTGTVGAPTLSGGVHTGVHR
jgi:hypothetical protein